MTSKQRIGDLVAGNDVLLFMKGIAAVSAVRLFEPGDRHPRSSRRRLSRRSTCFRTRKSGRASRNFRDWPTIPQLYVKGEFVGGSDIMMEMFESGELKQLVGRLRLAGK